MAQVVVLLVAGADRTADLGVMNPESAAAYKAFYRINGTFSGETVV